MNLTICSSRSPFFFVSVYLVVSFLFLNMFLRFIRFSPVYLTLVLA
jgi:hypothetical protein